MGCKQSAHTSAKGLVFWQTPVENAYPPSAESSDASTERSGCIGPRASPQWIWHKPLLEDGSCPGRPFMTAMMVLLPDQKPWRRPPPPNSPGKTPTGQCEKKYLKNIRKLVRHPIKEVFEMTLLKIQGHTTRPGRASDPGTDCGT